MALGLSRTRINVKGGGDIQIREINPTPSDTFLSLGSVKDVTFIDEYGMVESIDGAGDYIDTKPGSRHAHVTAMLQQSTKEEIDVMKDAAGKHYEIYYTVTLNDGSFQEFVAPICRITPGMNLAFASATERTIALDIHFLAPFGILTRTPVSYNTADREPYAVSESSSQIGAPSDAATVPQGGI
jgi:hypothetical protein